MPLTLYKVANFTRQGDAIQTLPCWTALLPVLDGREWMEETVTDTKENRKVSVMEKAVFVPEQ